MRNVLLEADVLIGHNIIMWDIPHIERILEINIKGQLIDTLALSWYIYPKRTKHGLESWGDALGFKKPKIDDWENQSVSDYIFRCESDVEINKRVWERFSRYLNDLYENNEDKEKLIKYLSFKLFCVALQEKSKWKLDVLKCQKHFKELLDKKNPIVNKLKELMPLVSQTAIIKKPKNYYKANLELSSRALKWEEIEQYGDIVEVGEDYMIYVKDYAEPNPNSHIQIKDWLFSWGWKPTTFKYEVNKSTGEKREIPQVKIDGELCESVLKLAENEPRIKLLEDLTVLSHRINILKGFLRDQKDGYLKASIGGLTNTLRFKHRELVNLPGVRRPYGEYIRGVLVAEEGYELCGSDMASLEDRTKQHYMWTHDPEYVKEMQTPDFDPHLALAEFAGALTPEQVKAHKEGTENHGASRYLYKTANYACIYGVGAFKLSKTLDISQSEAKSIIDAYWGKNWSVKKVADDQRIKTIKDQMWLLNPVNNLWYSLRYEKDKFSTLNQGTGTYCFDTWVKYILEQRKQLTGQFHDEVVLHIKKGHREACKKILLEALEKANKELNLNRELGIDIQFGDNYAQIH